MFDVEHTGFRAAFARLLIGFYALTLLPRIYPAIGAFRPVFAIYLGIVLVLQVMIQKHRGGAARSIIGGCVDVAVLTFIVHRIGSHETMFAAVYLFAGVMNAIASPPGVAMLLSALGALAYVGVEMAECLRLIPYGPDGSHHVPPSLAEAVADGALAALLIVYSTALVTHLVGALKRRESELQSANERLESISQRDPLTQLYNRRYLFTCIEHELKLVSRGRPMTLMMLDLDNFKHINDQYGHLRGDALLKEIAVALTRTCRTSDVVGRYGGDEFVIMLADTNAPSAQPLAARIATAIREVGLVFDTARPVTASVGVAEAQPHEGIASLLRRADENSYRAKQEGGNRVAA